MPVCRECGRIFKKDIVGSRCTLCDYCWIKIRCPKTRLKRWKERK